MNDQTSPAAPERGWLKPALEKAEQRAREMPDWMRTPNKRNSPSIKHRPPECGGE